MMTSFKGLTDDETKPKKNPSAVAENERFEVESE
jgi:hypothetical protein